MKIAITGGNGYIGARLCQYLANKGEQVIPVCFPSIPVNENWTNKMYAILQGDLREEKTIVQITELKPDVLIHLVSLDHFDSEKEPIHVNEINVLPTWRLLDACTKIGIKKFIYFSTIQVYGKLPNSIINETQQVKTANAYGLTHLLSEQICDHYNRNTTTNIITVRLSNSYGEPIFQENNCWWLAVNDLCRNAYTKNKILLSSDGTPQRDFIHGNDVCEAIRILVNTNEKLEDNIYHISSGKTLSLMELSELIRKEYQIRYNKWIPIITPQEVITDSKVVVPLGKYIISNNKIKTLGFSSVYTINRGINEIFNYLEKETILINDIL